MNENREIDEKVQTVHIHKLQEPWASAAADFLKASATFHGWHTVDAIRCFAFFLPEEETFTLADLNRAWVELRAPGREHISEVVANMLGGEGDFHRTMLIEVDRLEDPVYETPYSLLAMETRSRASFEERVVQKGRLGLPAERLLHEAGRLPGEVKKLVVYVRPETGSGEILLCDSRGRETDRGTSFHNLSDIADRCSELLKRN